jgi:hypothetical protein
MNMTDQDRGELEAEHGVMVVCGVCSKARHWVAVSVVRSNYVGRWAGLVSEERRMSRYLANEGGSETAVDTLAGLIQVHEENPVVSDSHWVPI